ncbi:hypothetical protein Daura_43340 [Dactylosporangium aurantiacum]|uniref:Uncharacterized protein n=1 Tax=Dactylosporangium aurantiacum TaxID=35754 RepID=A0A9Q9IHM5_9ACTN|nr:hypothetical protein [Dactylosporangium aurantiacum]MDG6102385.1 hypothetical protein [Dactylosporangium aurantiacum]UWZ53323.1 hypothetical protein Daura_43340 [Dactylosporangium aurantiacum]
MAFNDTLVVSSDGNPIDVLRACPVLDKPAARLLAERLFPGAALEEIGDLLLADALDPPRDVVYVGCYAGLDLVSSWTLTPQRPSQLDPVVHAATGRRQTLLHAAHGDAAWCSFGLWRDGALVRALSVCTDPGVLEDTGERLPFEADAPHDPAGLGDRALQALMGFSCAGHDRLDDVDPELIPVVAYRVTGAAVSTAS